MWKENPIRLGFRNTYQGGQITGFQFRMTISGHRGVFASMLSGGFTVKVDGVSYKTDKISLKFGDKTIPWSQIDNATDIFINYGEAITVIVESPGGLNDGLHKVEVGYSTSRGSAWNDDPELDEYFDFLPSAQRVSSVSASTSTPRLSVISADLVLVI
jgi:hypothetical protein